MAGTLTALCVHGVGNQPSDYAHDSRRFLRASMKERGVDCYLRSAWWAPYAEKYEHAFLQSTKTRGSVGNLAQKLVIGTLADALFYQGSPRLQEECWSLLDYEYAQLGSDKHNAVIFTHSLGALIATDWLRARPQNGIRKLVTFGCNLGLFNLDKGFDSPRQITCAGKWINIWHKRDCLGWPLSQDPSLAHVQDVQVSLGGVLAWTGLSHLSYWGDRKLWSRTIPDLLEGKK